MVTANDAAATAIQLFRLDARLCDQNPMKIARTTNNPSVSGNSLHQATTSLACCSNTQDIQRLSYDASVQTNPCTVFQVNPVHTTDLTRSLSDAQITQTTSTCSQTDSDSNSSSFKIVNAESMTKEHKNQSIIPIESMAQKQEDTSAQVSKENNESVFNNIHDHIKPCEQNVTIDPINKDILDCLDVALLSIPDCIMDNLEDINNSLMATMKKSLQHIASFQTGKYILSILKIMR